MKTRSFFPLLLVTTLILGFRQPVSAQPAGPGGGGPGMNASLMKLFGDHKEFSARTLVSMLRGNETNLTLQADFHMLDKAFRMDVDLGSMAGAQMSEQAASQMKQMGMDKMQTIARQDKKLMYLIYPGLKAYAEMPIPESELEAAEKDSKIEKKEEGKETIDGHPCVKSRATITDASGKVTEAVVWAASDMKDFPLQIETDVQGNTVRMTYRDVKFGKPDAKLFEPPTGYTRHESIQSLMQVAMQRMMGAGNKE